MKAIKIICNDDNETDETMVHWPNGTVEFYGVWALLKMLWWAARNGFDIEVIDGRKK